MTEETIWAIVELMGHVRLSGRLTEEEKFGAKMGRLDIPMARECSCANSPDKAPAIVAVPCAMCNSSGVIEEFVTQLFGGASVYRITIVTEAVARDVAKRNAPAPVSPWDYPKLTNKATVTVDTYEPRDDNDDDWDK